MSIIYEALKKAQRRLKITSIKNEKKKYWVWFYLGFIFISPLVFIFVLFLIFYTPEAKLLMSKSTFGYIAKARLEPAQNIKYKSAIPEFPEISLRLNGIIYMDGVYIALIDDGILREGDFIEGARITKISDKRVDLKFKDKSFSLRINK